MDGKTVFFVRHGQYKRDALMSLCENGINQSQCLGQYIKKCDIQFTGITTSPSDRAMQTTNYVNKIMRLPVKVDALIEEIGLPDGGMVVPRAFEKYVHPALGFANDTKHIVVSHGTIISALVERARGKIVRDYDDINLVYNASWSSITVDEIGRVVCILENQIGHLIHMGESFITRRYL